MFMNNEQVDKFLSFYEMSKSRKKERDPFEMSSEFDAESTQDWEESYAGTEGRDPFELSPEFGKKKKRRGGLMKERPETLEIREPEPETFASDDRSGSPMSDWEKYSTLMNSMGNF